MAASPDNTEGTIPNPFDRGRVALPKAELCARLTAAFQTHPQCVRVTVLEVYRLNRPDVSGCNWAFTLLLEPDGTPAEAYGPAYADVITLARRFWNLASDAER